MASYPRPNNRLSTTIFTPQNWNVQPDPLGGGGDTATVSRPGGPPNSVQFNQAGALGGSSQLLFSNNTLQALQLNVINSLNVKSGTLSVGDRVEVGSDLNIQGELLRNGAPFSTEITVDNTPTDGSNNPVSSNGVFDALSAKASIVYVDQSLQSLIDGAPSQLNTLNELSQALNDDENFGTSVINLINSKQDALIFDSAPTSGSQNVVRSGGVFTAVSAKQDTLTFDLTPTSGSQNPVRSNGIFDALQVKQDVIGSTTDLSLRSLTASGNVIVSTAPTLNTHLTNKSYVDGQVSQRQPTITTSTSLSIRNLTVDGSLTQPQNIGNPAQLNRTTISHGGPPGGNTNILVCNFNNTQRFSVREDGFCAAAGGMSFGGNLQVNGSASINNGITINAGNIVLTNGVNTLTITPTQITSTTTLGLEGSSVNANTATVVSNNSSSTSHYPLFVSATSGNLSLHSSPSYVFTPSTSTLSVPNITASGNITCSGNFLGGSSSFIFGRAPCATYYRPEATGTLFTDDSLGWVIQDVRSAYRTFDNAGMLFRYNNVSPIRWGLRAPRAGVYEVSFFARFSDNDNDVGIRPWTNIKGNLMGADAMFWVPRDNKPNGARRTVHWSMMLNMSNAEVFDVYAYIGGPSISMTWGGIGMKYISD